MSPTKANSVRPPPPRNSVTIATVAKRLGLAVCTVSSVLCGKAKQRRINDETSRRILEECKRLNYMPNQLARSLRASRSMMIGVVVADFRNDWAARILDGVRMSADRHSMLPLVLSHEWEPERERIGFESLMQLRAEAIITIPLPECVDIYAMAMQRGVALVLLGDTLSEMPTVDFVSWAHAPAVKTIMRHLISHGARRIATLEHRRQTQLTRAYFKTYREVLDHAGLPFGPDWRMLVSFEHEVEGALRPVFSAGPKRRPDALFCTNDGLAFVAVAVLRRMGLRVPEDVMVTGMGDLGKGDENGVSLSTVREPCEEIGRMAVETAMARVADHTRPPAHIQLPGTEVKSRHTTQRG